MEGNMIYTGKRSVSEGRTKEKKLSQDNRIQTAKENQKKQVKCYRGTRQGKIPRQEKRWVGENVDKNKGKKRRKEKRKK